MYYLKLLMLYYWNELRSEDMSTFYLNNERIENDLNHFPYDDEQSDKIKNIFSPYFLMDKQEIIKNNMTKDIKSTENHTLFNFDYEKENLSPPLFTSNNNLNIFNILSNKDKLNENCKNLNFKNIDIENHFQLTEKKRNRTNLESDNLCVFIKNQDIENNKKSKKRGRKTNKNNIKQIHSKMAPDNIISKIKTNILKFCFNSLNSILKAFYKTNEHDKITLKKINSEISNKLSKDEELELLNMSLKDIFSKNISSKFNKIETDYNQKAINQILKNDDNDNISFVFNMTLKEWLDIFTLKTTVKEIANQSKNTIYQKLDFSKIEQSFSGIDKLLNKIKKEGEEYLELFISYLYNYERYFYLKNSRKKKRKEKDIVH